jgi:hypothetical protein
MKLTAGVILFLFGLLGLLMIQLTEHSSSIFTSDNIIWVIASILSVCLGIYAIATNEKKNDKRR